MTQLAQIFEDFQRDSIADIRGDLDAGQSDGGAQLSSYEDGYRSGWEDAVKSNNLQVASQADSIAQVLADLDSQRSRVSAQLTGIFVQITQKMCTHLLAETIDDVTLSAAVKHIRQGLKQTAASKLDLSVSPDQYDFFKNAIQDDSMTLSIDRSLEAGKALISAHDEKVEIDATNIAKEVCAILKACENKISIEGLD